MKKVIIYIVAIIGGLCGVVSLLLIGAQTVIFDESRFHKAYQEYDRYEYIGIAEDDLHEVTHELLEYIKGNREDIVMYADINGTQEMVFEEREQLHMVDVLRLFAIGFDIRNVSIIVAILAFALVILLYKKASGKIIARGYLIGFSIFFVLILIASIAMIVDFSTLFTKFHLLLFDNDLWLLDIDEDIMIRMFPEQFFNSLGIWIGIFAIIFISVPAIAASVYLKIKKKEQNQNAI